MFTSGQWRSLAIVPHVTGALSMMGDSWVLFDILWRRRVIKKQPLTTYHRIIMAMNCWDLTVVTMGFFLSTWPMPRGTPNVMYASGTRQTCTMQGFFTQLSVIVKMYNANTAWYYLLVVHYGLSNNVIQRRYEKWMHICPIVLCVSFSVFGLIQSLYSPSTLWCWMNAEPVGCTQSYTGKEGVPCERGDNAFIYRLAIFYVPIWSCIIFATCCMIVIYNTVRKQEQKSKRYNANRFNVDERNNEKKKNTQTREVAKQAYFYIGGFILVWTPPSTVRILQFFNITSYPLTLLMTIFVPLEGFINSMVYARPRLIKYLEQRKRERSAMGEVEKEGWVETAQAVGQFLFTAKQGSRVFRPQKRRNNWTINEETTTEIKNKEDNVIEEEDEADGEDYGTYISDTLRDIRPDGLAQNLLEHEG